MEGSEWMEERREREGGGKERKKKGSKEGVRRK